METHDIVWGSLMLGGLAVALGTVWSFRRERAAELDLMDRILQDAALRERERQRDLWRGQKRR